MKVVHKEAELRTIIQQTRPVVIVFKAAWCGDCRFIEPFMPDVENKYADQLDFIEVDRDEMPNISEEWNVLGIPSFITFKNGQETIRFVSKLRKTQQEIEEFLDRAIEVSKALT